MEKQRELIFFENHFLDFYLKQSAFVQEKIEYVFKIIMTVKIIRGKFLKRINGNPGLYEIKIEFEGNIFRIFSLFDKGNVVVLLNGFQKKSQKTPKNEIDLALRLKKKYIDSKK
jgi:phage-related protein